MNKKEIEQAMTCNKSKFKEILNRWNNDGIIFAEDTNLADACFKASTDIIKEILLEHGGIDYKDCYCTGAMTDNVCCYAYFTWVKWNYINDVTQEIIKRHRQVK